MDVQREILCLARGIENREHNWQKEENPKYDTWGLCPTSSYDKPLEYHLLAVKRLKRS